MQTLKMRANARNVRDSKTNEKWAGRSFLILLLDSSLLEIKERGRNREDGERRDKTERESKKERKGTGRKRENGKSFAKREPANASL